MNFFKTLISSFVDSFKILWSKELLGLLYLTYNAFKLAPSDPKLIVIYLCAVLAILFTKINSFAFLILFWFLTVSCLAYLRPSVDFKNYKYFLSNLLVVVKLLSLFLVVFYVPYSILHGNYLLANSWAVALFLALFGLLMPFKFSSFKMVAAGFLSLLGTSLLVGFKGLLYHILLLGYLNFEKHLSWLLSLCMFDKQVFFSMGLAGFFISPVVIFFVLSVLDSRKTSYYQMRGLVRGLKLLFLNYPLSFIWFNLFRYLVIYLDGFFIDGLSNHPWLIIFLMIFYYFYLSFLTNLYVKKVHEQFLTYF